MTIPSWMATAAQLARSVIQRAVTELHDYLDRKVKEVRDVERLMRAG
jgi:hypothetical protein